MGSPEGPLGDVGGLAAAVYFFQVYEDIQVGSTGLTAYSWPGNVRELENVIERALIVSSGKPLTFDDLSGGRSGGDSKIPAPPDESLKLDEAMSRHIRRVLEMNGGKVHGKDGAAEVLGINPSTLRNRMNLLGIPYAGGLLLRAKGSDL